MTGKLTAHLNQVDQDVRGGNLGKAEGGKTGCNGTTENAESDEMDWINE